MARAFGQRGKAMMRQAGSDLTLDWLRGYVSRVWKVSSEKGNSG